jgi:diaminopimelate epimerase
MAIDFAKFHGFGNDYIVIERRHLAADTDLSILAKEICHRHTGAGADGIAVIEKSKVADSDFICEIVNPDGSIAGFSGNGTRCAVSYIYHNDLWSDDNLRLQVRSGIKRFRLLNNAEPGHYHFAAEIGKPAFSSEAVPIITTEHVDDVIDLPVDVNGRMFLMTCVNVGNPVAVTFVDDFELDWRSYGKELEVHPVFPQKANIVFVKCIDDANLEIRIWERAAGETSSSGTCSSGAAVLAAKTGRTGRNVSVHAVGGTTEFEWRDDDEMIITGQADLSYTGSWPTD